MDVVRGVELPTGDLVTVSDEELLSIAPERSRTIDIEEFVDLAEIDPVFFEKTYHVAPLRSSGAEKPYLLLLRAMQASNMVGIGRFVLRTRPHLVAVRPLENALALETLYFADEVRNAGDVTFGLSSLTVTEREVKMAQQLIAALATRGAVGALAQQAADDSRRAGRRTRAGPDRRPHGSPPRERRGREEGRREEGEARRLRARDPPENEPPRRNAARAPAKGVADHRDGG